MFCSIHCSAGELRFDTYLAPWATVEQALVRISQEDYDGAQSLLTKAK